MAKSDVKPVEKLSYEEASAELEGIVHALELGEQSLDEALALFERGQALTRRCIELLDQAELKVNKLSGETLVPFEAEE